MMQQNQDQLIDVYDVIYQPWWHSWWWKVSCILFGVTVLALFFAWAWKKYQYRYQQLSVEEQLQQALEMLKQKKYISDTDLRDAYFTLTQLLKKYLSDKYNVSFFGKTDLELMQDIVKFDIDVTNFQSLFRRAYSIKYEKSVVNEEMVREDIELVDLLIQKETDKD